MPGAIFDIDCRLCPRLAQFLGYAFAHAAEHRLPQGHTLLDSYHCSRYNTQTGRLTALMFDQVFQRARQLIDESR